SRTLCLDANYIEVPWRADHAIVRNRHERAGLCSASLRLRDESLLSHEREHCIAALFHASWILRRLVDLGTFRHRRERRCFSDRELRRRFSEIVSRSRLDPGPSVRESNLIHIRFEDLLLRVVLLHLDLCRLLAKFSRWTWIAAIDDVGVHVADQLLRHGAGSCPVAEDVVLDCAGNAYEIDPVVLVKTLVFDSDERLGHVFRQGSNRYARANLCPDFAHEGTVSRKNLGALRLRYDLPGITSAA